MKVSFALAVLILAACGDDTPQVPFKLSKQTAAPQGGASATGQAAPEHGASYPEGTQRIELAGHALSLAKHAFRAALELDLDQDGRRDALFLLQDERGAPALGVAIADAEGLGSVEIKSHYFEAQSCRVPSASLQPLGAGLVLARMAIACEAPAANAPAEEKKPEAPANALPSPDETPEAPAEPMPLDLIVRADPSLELTSQLRVISPHVQASWSALDADSDGHGDLNVALRVAAEGFEPLSVVLTMLDRSSGFAFDFKDFEATFLKIADEAKQARKSQPDRALALAERVLAAHRALCAEGGDAEVELDGTRGLPCGPSLAAGRALTIQIAGFARRGRLLDAVRRYGELLDAGVYTITANDRERADYALRERTLSLSWRPGPNAVGVSSLPVRRSAIELSDEHRLIVRDAQGANAHDLTSGAHEPAPTAGNDVVLRDPSGKLAITSLTTSCLGVQANVVSAAQVVAGVAAGSALATPVILPFDPPLQGCSTGGVPHDARALSILGWTSVGLVIARDAELFVVKLDASGNVATPAQPLASITTDKRALFAALGSGAISDNGRFQLIETNLGLLRVDREQGGALLIGWPTGTGAERVSDVAVSPSGARVALLVDGRAQIADVSSAAAAPAPGAPAAPAPAATTPPPAAAPPEKPAHTPPPAPPEPT